MGTAFFAAAYFGESIFFPAPLMRVIPSAIPDVLIFEPTVFGDDRGYFFESFRQDLFEQHVGHVAFVQIGRAHV